MTTPHAPSGHPTEDALAGLATLLDGMHLAAPERLGEVAAAAGRELGLRVVVYLVDYEQRVLHPVPGPVTGDRAPLAVDTTLAGRAYRLVRPVPAGSGGRPRLWLPLLDGVERLGVLEAGLPDGADPHDSALRAPARWLSALIGHLVTITSRYGDGLDLLRRRRARTPAGELIWQLLPPLTAGTGTFVLAGMLEPCYEVGGDAFDYSISPRTVSLAIFDAAGHSLPSGLIAAATLAAHRSARRGGHDLTEQARVIDQTIATHIADAAFATGVLAELDVSTGRLRYVNAGHPHPLLLRGGKVVRTLAGGRRPPFGLGSGALTVAEEVLQPDDWLVLYTDGITEARNHAGEFFGDARLVDLLEREAAADHPPPETVRRLVHAVLGHHDGALQDDATVLLARWTRPGELDP